MTTNNYAHTKSIRAELMEPPKKWTIALIVSIFSVILFFIIWANIAELDEVTTGQGQVVPSGKTKVVQNLEGGIVDQILVKEGDEVTKGQIILRIDDTGLSSSYRENEARYLSLLASTSRLKAEVEGTELVFPEAVSNASQELLNREMALYNSRQDELRSAIDILKQQYKQREQEITELEGRVENYQTNYDLAAEEAKILEPLVKDGVASKVELLRLKREVSRLKGDLQASKDKINKAKAALVEADQRINERRNQFIAESREQLNDQMSKVLALREFLTAAEDRVSRTEVKSPVSGIIKELHVSTVGEVIQPGQDLITIVPIEDSLLVQARIQPQDVAFLSPGQDAIVKVTAFDFLIYGGLEAKLENISPDTITDEQGNRFYQIYLRTDKSHLDNPKGEELLDIKPGMVVEADILTGKKTVMQYLLKPINRARHKAMRER